MTIFDEALNGLFADPNLGETAVYRPVFGAPQEIKVVPRAADLLLAGLAGGQQVHPGMAVEVRAQDIPSGTPGDGDQVDLAGARFRVRSARLIDIARDLWLLDLVPAVD